MRASFSGETRAGLLSIDVMPAQEAVCNVVHGAVIAAEAPGRQQYRNRLRR